MQLQLPNYHTITYVSSIFGKKIILQSAFALRYQTRSLDFQLENVHFGSLKWNQKHTKRRRKLVHMEYIIVARGV